MNDLALSPASRVLALVPEARDDAVMAKVLADAGLQVRLCPDVEQVLVGIEEGAGVVILAEEMLALPQRERLKAVIAAQPPWSDLPLLLLSPFRRDGFNGDRWALQELGNVTVLERPVRLAALLTAVQSAVRARTRQFELRDRIRMMRESQLRERERAAELESLLRAVPAAIWIASDARCSEITGNPISYQWLAMAPGNISASGPTASQRGFVEYRDGRPLAAHELPMQRAAATAEPVLGEELELRFTNGRSRHLFGNAVPLLDDAGAPRGALAAFVDVTELKAAEIARDRQAQRLRLLAEAASVVLTNEDPDAMVQRLFHRIGSHVGLDTYFRFAVVPGERKLSLQSFFGVEEARIREIAELDFGAAVCGRVAECGRMILVNDVQACADPGARWIRSLGLSVYVSFPLLAESELLGTLSFGSRSRTRFDAEEIEFLSTLCHYVTLASERVRLIGSLREADRRKDEFLAMLAHELRNPLAPIRQAAAVTRMPAASAAQLEWSHAVIERQVRHMALLLDDLLDVSRISRGRLELDRKPLWLKDVVNVAIETARPHLEARRHRFEVALPEEPLALLGDALRLAQVLSNLLTNAAKYTPQGGRVRMAAAQRDDRVEITVADNGIGIAPDQLERLFDMFTQSAAPPDLRERGLGIGLAVARSLVALHEGTLEAHSEGLGRGAQFVVRLPLAGRVPAQLPPPRSVVPQGTPARRVLVVDDNVDAAESLAMLLRLQGHTVKTVHNGAAAIGAVSATAPEVVFLDLGMPEMDGYEVARRLRLQHPSEGLTLVAVTGWGQAEDRRRTRAAGFDFHLTKPVDAQAIEDILMEHVRAPREALVNGAHGGV
jgi:signal transduction histidine kinase/DNA-binding response OmpR family regulator